MTRSTYIVACALGLFLAPACGDDDDDDRESVQALCQQACTTAASLSCPNEDAATCAGECEALDIAPEPCVEPAMAALECIAERPASDWTCNAGGESVLKEGICDAEGTALFDCVFDTAEEGTCPFEEDGECDDPTGTAVCPDGTDLADCA